MSDKDTSGQAFPSQFFDKFEVLNIVETDSECLIRWRWHYADSMLAAREFGK